MVCQYVACTAVGLKVTKCNLAKAAILGVAVYAGLHANGATSTQAAPSSRSSGAMLPLSQRPSFHRTWSGTSSGTTEEDCAANPLHLTPALAEECSALVRSLATGSSEAPAPEDSAMESSLTGAMSGVAYAAMPFSEHIGPVSGECAPREPFSGDSPDGVGDRTANCVTDANGDVEPTKHLPAIVQSSAAACLAQEKHVGAAEEQCMLSKAGDISAGNSPSPAQQPLLACKGAAASQSVHADTISLHSDHHQSPPVASHKRTPTHPTVPGSAAGNLSPRSESTLLDTERFGTPGSPAALQEAGNVGHSLGRVQSPDMFEDAAESLGTPLSGVLSALTATPSRLQPTADFDFQQSAGMSPAQQVFASASKPGPQRWRLPDQYEQAAPADNASSSGAVLGTVADSLSFATPCESRAFFTDIDRESDLDGPPTCSAQQSAPEDSELRSPPQPARVFSHMLDSFGTMESVTEEGHGCSTDAAAGDSQRSPCKNIVACMHKHACSDLELSEPVPAAGAELNGGELVKTECPRSLTTHLSSAVEDSTHLR